MESPERSECISAPVDQGSPFFKYLCGLSPIKPTRSVHVVQTYAELSLPPPPAVFTSPANPHKCGGRSKRGLVVSRTASTHVTVEAVGIMGNKCGGDKENHPNQAYIPKSYFAGQVDARHPSSHASSEFSRPHLCPKSEQEQGTGSRVDTPTKFECGDVSDYLADPPEGGLYTTASSSQLVPKSYGHRLSPSSEENGYHKDDHQNEITPNEASSLDGAHCDDPANITERNFNTIGVSDLTCHQISDLVKTDTRESLVFRSSGSSSDHEGSGNCGNEKLSCVDQETAAMAFLLVGDADCDGATRNDWGASHSAIAELSTQQTPDFSAIGRLSNEAQLKAREDIEVATSKALANPTNAETDKQLEDRKDVLVVGTGGQRGVRRRCLDFETSVRRKSSGGGSSRKSLVLKPKNLPVSSATTSVSSIPPSILCERAVATSDATNSVVAASRALDSHSHMSSRPECTTSFSRVLSPGLLRISRCSVQGNTDIVPTDQCSTDPTRAGSDCNNHSSSVGIPSGIGLHLNSLTGSISFSPTNRDFKQAMGITSTTKGAVASLLGMPGLIGTNSDNLSDEFGKSTVGLEARSNSFSMAPATSNFGTGVVISVMERSRVTLRKSLPVTDITPGAPRTNTLQSLAVGARQSLEGSRSSRGTGIDKKFVSGGKKRLVPQDVLQQTNVDYADEYDSPRSQKKRRKSPTASGEKSGEGCKRCNCKKSKCLKLYCECFAAGTYCVGSCTCHDCFNKPEHEDTVLNTRHQIESRNPLAFAPKIVHSGDASPKRGEEVIETPVSARHKRGCNCKKSLCLKKYCECYQAGVGCSEGCRCEGCKNMYGRKEAVEDSDDKETASDAVESGSMEDELEMSRIGFHAGVGNMDQQRNNSKDLSPITPSFLYGQGRTTGRVRSAGKKRSASPLSNSHLMAKLPRSPGCATRSSVKFQSNNSAQQTPHMQGSRGVNSPISTPKLSRVNQLSPRWDGLGDICTLTPLPHPPLRPTPASLSTLDRTGASPCFSCQSIEPISSYQPEKLDSVTKSSPLASQRASDHSPLSSFESRNPLISSDYPMSCAAGLSSSAYIGSDNLKAGDARSSFLCDESDTPDFLKYTDTMNSPVITKSGSPKQKRVSPPHVEGMRDRNRDGRVVFDSPARSSPGLRSGRKFILQALPSLPPVKALTNSSQNQVSSSPQV